MALADLPQGFGWILGGMAVLTGLTIINRARARRRDVGVDLRDRPRPGGGSPMEAREAMDEIFVKLQEYSRETLARLDTKIRVLNELIARADAKIAELRSLQESGAKPAAAPSPAPEKPRNPLHEKVARLAAEGRSQPEITEATGLQRGEIEMILGLREGRA